MQKLTTNRFPQTYIFAKIYDKEKNKRKGKDKYPTGPKNSAAKGEVNRLKETNQRAAAEILEVEGPGDSPEPVEESGGGGERRSRRGGRAVRQC